MSSTPDTTRFLALYQPHQDSLWRFARSLVRTHHDAEDVVSETMIRALEGLHRVRDDAAFLSFLFTIASRVVRRQQWRRRLFGEYNEDQVAMRPSSDSLPDVQADIVLLREAMQQLPEATRQTVVLFEINNMTLEEIRVIQGGTLSGVKSRLVRGRKMLARILRVDELKEPFEEANENAYTISSVEEHHEPAPLTEVATITSVLS